MKINPCPKLIKCCPKCGGEDIQIYEEFLGTSHGDFTGDLLKQGPICRDRKCSYGFGSSDLYFFDVWNMLSDYMHKERESDHFADSGKKVNPANGETSDGYHTFSELYDHRHALFIALMRTHSAISWRANNHDDGSNYKGYFVAGMHLPTGDISYHLPNDLWTQLDNTGIATSNLAPKWDGHTSNDVVSRLIKWGNQGDESSLDELKPVNEACLGKEVILNFSGGSFRTILKSIEWNSQLNRIVYKPMFSPDNLKGEVFFSAERLYIKYGDSDRDWETIRFS